MEHRRLGTSGMKISAVGLGAWQIGGPGGGFAWGPQPDDRSIAAVHAALEAGVNWIDTAPAYGLGHSEEVVGRALKRLGKRRPYVFTKCSLVWDDRRLVWSDLSPDSIRREAAASLRRLAVDAIDLYQIHWPYPDEQLEDAWETLVELRDAGTVREIGISNASLDQLRRLQVREPVVSLQSVYSLLRRELEKDILPYCAGEGMGVLAYSPLASGLLSGTMSRARMQTLPDDDWRHRDPMFQEPYLTQHLAAVEVLREVAADYNTSPAELALAWVLSRKDVTAAIVGISRSEQVPRSVGGAALSLTAADREHLEKSLGRVLRLPAPPDRFQPRTQEEVLANL